MFAVALTDHRLLENLRTTAIGGVINFWTPTPWNVRGLQPGDRLYFLMKSPIRKIAGYGEFRRYANMRASLAWSAYGIGNGVASLDELVGLVDHFASMNSKKYEAVPDPEIGCIELANPAFYTDDEFISPNAIGLSIPSHVVKIKYYFPSKNRCSDKPLLRRFFSRGNPCN
jgi:putative restriction endonuclease